MGKKLVIYGVDYSENAIGKDMVWKTKETFSFESSKGSKTFKLEQKIAAGTTIRLNVKSVIANGGGLFFGIVYADAETMPNAWGGSIYDAATTSEFICPKDVTALQLWTASEATAVVELQVYE